MIGTKAVTICGWIKPYGLGESDHGVIITNEKIWIGLQNTSTPKLEVSADVATFAYSGLSSISLNNYNLIINPL